MTKGKQSIVITCITVTLILLLLILRTSGNEATSVNSIIVSHGNMTEIVPANGKIRPVTEVKISPDVSGEIIDIFFMEGEQVRKGDILLTIKQDLYKSLVEGSQARLNSINALLSQVTSQLKQAELEYKRSMELYLNKVISQEEYEKSYSEYTILLYQAESARYDVESSAAALKEAKENLAKTIIYSPIDGTLSRLNIEKGERVVGTSQMAGTEMLRIADLNHMEVVVNVSENDIIRLEVQDTAIIKIDAYPEKTFTGIVTHIANSSTSLNHSIEQVTNFKVRVKIIAKEPSLRPGMSASVEITTETKENIISIPLECITTRDDLKPKGSAFVFKIKSDLTVIPIKVSTGIQDIRNIEILSGLKIGDTIVSGPYTTINTLLQDGSQISPYEN